MNTPEEAKHYLDNAREILRDEPFIGRPFFTMVFAWLLSASLSAQTTQIVVVGTVHQATINYNPDSISTILQRVKPDLILLELDSSFFTPTFQFKFRPTENETIGVASYRRDSILVRPFEFEGRNAYQRRFGILRKPTKVFGAIGRLARKGKLNSAHQQIVTRYRLLTDSLNRIGQQRPFTINQATTDQLAAQRQYYQYHKIKEVVDQTASLARFRNFYKINTAFWDTRNKAMAEHIIRYGDLYVGKRIVVLTGYFHRYYLLQELERKQANSKFVLKEYYQY